MRLTIKQRTDEFNKTYIDGVSVDYLTADLNASRVMNKLGQLEDIEDELGIDLITLFKALKNGIHKKDCLDCCYDTKLRFMKGEWYLAQPFDENYTHIVKTKDYGKTWALTEEELL